tara:strand:+ start:11772 stop:13349 length:1578 start_codon:yes stop_codon:yes gene_type:complete
MFDKLNLLKKHNFYPDVIFDIGAHKGLWTLDMMNIYPSSLYKLFEAGDYKELKNLKKFINIEIFNNIILNENDGYVDWYENESTGDSIYKENTNIYENIKSIKKKCISLNSFIDENEIDLKSKKIFMKIDCQGAEISILKGSSYLYENLDFILIEMPLFGEYNRNVDNFYEHINFMDSIGFIPFEKIESHYLDKFNFQIDLLFVKKKSKHFINFINKPCIYSIMLSNFERTHVINYVKKQKDINPNFKVIDIGGSAEYTSWSYPIIDYIVDINSPQQNKKNIKFFKLNVNYDKDWDVLINYVNENGKFDFCICSHIIEDISLPQVLLNNLKYIAKEGFIGIPTKYIELSKIEGDYMGYIHHRWIYTIKNNILNGFPKVNFIDYDEDLIKIGKKSNFIDLSFFWKNDINYNIINNNYLGPNKPSVIQYYKELINDDIDILNNNKHYNYHIYTIENYSNINGDFISVIIPIENILYSLKLMENKGFIPFDFIDDIDDKNIGKIEFKILFINKSHNYNKLVNDCIKSF